jgi:hypothetical protein
MTAGEALLALGTARTVTLTEVAVLGAPTGSPFKARPLVVTWLVLVVERVLDAIAAAVLLDGLLGLLATLSAHGSLLDGFLHIFILLLLVIVLIAVSTDRHSFVVFFCLLNNRNGLVLLHQRGGMDVEI